MSFVCYCNCNLKGQVHDFDSFADRWQQLHKNHSCRCNLENGGSSRQWKKVGGHLQYRGCTNTIIERAKNFNHAKSCLDKKTYWKNFFLSVKTRNIKSLSCKKIIAQSKDLYIKSAKINENALTDRRWPYFLLFWWIWEKIIRPFTKGGQHVVIFSQSSVGQRTCNQ